MHALVPGSSARRWCSELLKVEFQGVGGMWVPGGGRCSTSTPRASALEMATSTRVSACAMDTLRPLPGASGGPCWRLSHWGQWRINGTSAGEMFKWRANARRSRTWAVAEARRVGGWLIWASRWVSAWASQWSGTGSGLVGDPDLAEGHRDITCRIRSTPRSMASRDGSGMPASRNQSGVASGCGPTTPTTPWP